MTTSLLTSWPHHDVIYSKSFSCVLVNKKTSLTVFTQQWLACLPKIYQTTWSYDIHFLELSFGNLHIKTLKNFSPVFYVNAFKITPISCDLFVLFPN